MDDVFKALADPSRRLLLDRLRSRNGQTLGELGSDLEMTRQSVSKHLDILESANLISTVRRGREKLHYLNAEPINAISERWISKYDQGRVTALADLKFALESNVMSIPEFVYTSYIKASPELVWRGITDPKFTRRYWGMEFHTDWTVGQPYAAVHSDRGIEISDDQMIVKEYDPYRRLSYTWQSYTPELVAAIGYSEEFLARAQAEPRSTVTFELTPDGDETKLTVIHSGFAPEGVVAGDVSNGWPKVISWLKSFLESGAYQNIG